PGDLNVVSLVAILFQAFDIGRHEWKTLDLAEQADVAGRWIETKFDAPERFRHHPVVAPVVVECPHPQPLRANEFDVDVGDAAPFSFGEPFGFGEQYAVLPDH